MQPSPNRVRKRGEKHTPGFGARGDSGFTLLALAADLSDCCHKKFLFNLAGKLNPCRVFFLPLFDFKFLSLSLFALPPISGAAVFRRVARLGCIV